MSPSSQVLLIEDVVQEVKRFRDARDWEQFHTLQNLINSVSIEAAELLEITQWKTHDVIEKIPQDKIKLEALKSECADILIYLMLVSDKCGFNLLEAVRDKIALNDKRYPVEKSKGSATKYNQL